MNQLDDHLLDLLLQRIRLADVFSVALTCWRFQERIEYWLAKTWKFEATQSNCQVSMEVCIHYTAGKYLFTRSKSSTLAEAAILAENLTILFEHPLMRALHYKGGIYFYRSPIIGVEAVDCVKLFAELQNTPTIHVECHTDYVDYALLEDLADPVRRRDSSALWSA